MLRILYPNRWLVWTIAIVVIIALFVWYKIQMGIIEMDTLTNQRVVTLLQTKPNVSDVDTSNWKTYRNEKYGFEFKYPTNFQIRPQEEYAKRYQMHIEEGVTEFEIYNPADKENYENSMDIRSRNRSIHIKISSEPQKELKIMREIIIENNKDYPFLSWRSAEEIVNINGKDIYFYQEPSIVGAYPIFYLITSLYYLQVDGWNEDFLREILSTLKFFEPKN